MLGEKYDASDKVEICQGLRLRLVISSAVVWQNTSYVGYVKVHNENQEDYGHHKVQKFIAFEIHQVLVHDLQWVLPSIQNDFDALQDEHCAVKDNRRKYQLNNWYEFAHHVLRVGNMTVTYICSPIILWQTNNCNGCDGLKQSQKQICQQEIAHERANKMAVPIHKKTNGDQVRDNLHEWYACDYSFW